MTNNIKATLKILFISLVLGGISLWLFNSSDEKKIKKSKNKLEIVNSYIIKNYESANSDLVNWIISDNTFAAEIIKEVLSNNNLCEIEFYPSYGISYKFKCEDNSFDHFINTDEQYYLIKVINLSKAEKFISYEQFQDFRIRIDTLENNWFFIKQKIFYD